MSCLLTAGIQDIQAEEAMNDWRGRRANRVQLLSDTVSITRQKIEDINNELSFFDDWEMTELTQTERIHQGRLQKDYRQAK